MEWIARGIEWSVGSALPWSHEDADAVMRSRLRIVGTPQAPNKYGLIAIAYHLVVLPVEPEGSETPIATAACILSVN